MVPSRFMWCPCAFTREICRRAISVAKVICCPACALGFLTRWLRAQAFFPHSGHATGHTGRRAVLASWLSFLLGATWRACWVEWIERGGASTFVLLGHVVLLFWVAVVASAARAQLRLWVWIFGASQISVTRFRA